MRIAFSGTACTGKTTLVNAFKQRWPMFASPNKTYRDVIKENKLEHSSLTTDETQLLILDWMMAEQLKYPKGTKVVYDRCPWDNLAYTLHGNATGKISDSVAAATISFVKESMKNLDIIFWIKHNPAIKIVKDDLRDPNQKYILEVDATFNELFEQYMENLEQDVFYPKDDCPAIICIDEYFPLVDDRLMFVGEFIDYKGDLIETTQSVLDPENLDYLEKMLKDQNNQTENEFKLKQILKEFKNEQQR